MMSDKEYHELLESMKKDGYHENEPIVLYEGAILDGRNRYKAAQELNILPMFTQFAGDKQAAYNFARSSNMARKHWSSDQWAMIATDLLPYERELAKSRMLAGVKIETDPVSKQTQGTEKGKSRDKAAATVGVSGAKVQRAETVKKKNPKLAQDVKDGKKTLAEAEKEVKAQERKQARAEIAQAGQIVPTSEKWNVYQGDIRTWNAPRQYDFIITDPPYPKEFLPLWETLAERAGEWLKDGGLLIAMSGQSYLHEIYRMMSAHLDYYWTASYLTPGQPTPLRQVNVNTTWKPLLIYRKRGDTYKGKIFGDVFVSDGNDKDFHKWGQSISGMTSIISKICLPGQSILDPFCGAGTTGIAAVSYGCFFDGLELEAENVNISKARIAEAK
jgi:site-specific DNA-methyltransferase (adenine-specific)